jgi:hypothetical protein
MKCYPLSQNIIIIKRLSKGKESGKGAFSCLSGYGSLACVQGADYRGLRAGGFAGGRLRRFFEENRRRKA